MLNKQTYIAIAPSQSPQQIEIVAPENAATTTSIWALAGAVILGSIPHLWKFISGQQSAQTNLTTTLLQKLTDSYQLSSVSNETFRAMLNAVAQKPTELAEENALALRDLLGETADLRGQILKLHQKVDNLASMAARQAQNNS